MSLIATPRQLRQRALFYRQLSQMLEAGLTISAALTSIARGAPATYRKPIKALIDHIAQGATVSDAFGLLGNWVPSLDIALIAAAENSGRLDGVFKSLSEYYDGQALLLRKVIADLAYPVFLFHFAVVLFPFIEWFRTNMSLTMFALKTVGVLVPIYAVVWGIIFVMQPDRKIGVRTWVENLTRPVPILGTARHYLALSRLSSSLEALISAGVGIIEAWEMAATASGSPAILKVVTGWRRSVESGLMPSEAVNQAPDQFPEVFANLYRAGEASGQLEDTLRHLRAYYQEEGTQRFHLLAQWVPRLIYFAVALLVAYKVVGFYLNYFNMLNNVMNGGNPE